jgi:hypothetical protein
MAKKKGSTSKQSSKKKAPAKKRASKKRRTAQPLMLTMAAAAGPGNCLSLSRAGRIVQDASNGPHDVDLTLLEVGFITQAERDGFRRDVRNRVLQDGCSILEDDIPNGEDDTLRTIRDTIQEKAE